MSDPARRSAADSDAIRDRTDLIGQLSVGCELEQGLCLQYLFTAFTLKDSLSEGLTLDELSTVRKWKANIFLVAAQEMLHLAQVANLLAAVGGTVQLQRPNFPQSKFYYPTLLPWGLFPFSRETVRLYALYERPAKPRDEDARLLGAADALALEDVQLSAAEEATLYHEDPALWLEKLPHSYLPQRHLGKRAKAARHVTTIGELYGAIGQAFATLCPPPAGELIIGSPRAQVDGELIDFPQILKVADRQAAAAAVDLIVRQGEGAPADRSDSHFGIFVDILHEYDRLKQARPAFEPSRDVHPNPLSRLHVDNSFPGWRLIADDFTRDVNDLASDVYQSMMLMLYRFFATADEEPAQRRILARTAIYTMTTAIKPLGEALTRLPMGDEPSPGAIPRPQFAGPSFEINRSIQLLPFQDSAWIAMHERLLELAQRASALSVDPRGAEPGHGGAALDLEAAAATLTRIAGEFGVQAQRITSQGS